MAYELHVNTVATGVDSLNAAVTATERLDDRTRKIAEAIQNHILANTKLTDIQAKLALQETQLEILREKHRMQMEALAAGTLKAAQAQDQHNASMGRSTASVRDATAALRTLEGGMPIRSAARLLTMFEGFGPALSAAFPLFGAIALFGVAEKIADKLGLHLNIWKEIGEAQKASNKAIQEANREYDRLHEKLQQIELDEVRRNQGPAAADRLQASRAGGRASTFDQSDINRIELEIGAIGRLLSLRGGASPSADDVRYAKMAGIQDVFTPTQQLGFGGAAVGGAYTMRTDLMKSKLNELYADLRAAQERQRVGQGEAGGFSASADEDDRKKAEEAARKARQRELEMRRFEDEMSGKGLTPVDRIFQQRDEMVSRGFDRGRMTDAALVGASAQLAKEQATADKRDLEMGIRSGKSSDTLWNDEVTKALEKLDRTIVQSFLKAVMEAEKAARTEIDNQRRLDDAEGAGALRRSRSAAQGQLRMMGIRYRNQPGTLAGAEEGFQIGAAGQDYEVTASRLRREQGDALALPMRTEEEKRQRSVELNRIQVEGVKAQQTLWEQIDQARMDREEKILQLQQQQQEEVLHFATGLIGAAQDHSAGGFLKGQARSLENSAIGNLLRMGLGTPGGKGLLGSLHMPGFLGKVLEGTPFGTDPAKAATTANTTATQQNTAAIMAFTRSIAMSRSGGGGGAVPGMGGGGIGGDGGGFSETDTPSWGLPTAGSSGDYGGEFGPAVAVPGASGFTAAKMIGIAGAAAAGVMGAIGGFRKGGVSGDLGGIGALASAGGAIAMMAGLSGPLAPILAGVGLGMSLLGSVLGTGPQARENQINKRLQDSQFMAPTAINMTMSTGGTYADTDRFGNVRNSSLSPIPMVQQGYFDYRYGTTVPGSVVSPFGGPWGGSASAGNQSPTVIIHAMDSQDVKRVFERHMPVIGEALNKGIQTGVAGTGLSETISRL